MTGRAPVSRMDEVLQHALVRQPVAIEWDEEAEAAKAASLAVKKGDAGALTAH